jgi:4-azaleucine resistance transporter AzlC
VLLGILPFGLVVGVVAVDAGYGALEALGLSVAIFAGASQLAAIDLLARGAPLAVIVLTVFVINLRFAMYSASLAPHLADLPRWQRALGAYGLTDQAYAVSIVRFQEPAPLPYRFGYYLGASLSLWLPWQLATVVGALLGDTLPDALPLDFAVPLMFLALLVPAVRDRPTVVAALTSGTFATVAYELPWNVGMLLAAFVGIGAGWATSRRLPRGPT